MRHATSSSSEEIREKERIDGISFRSCHHSSFLSSLLACCIIGMCQATVYVYLLGGLKHDHHLSHTQISSLSLSLSPTLDSRTEKNENITKKKTER